MRAWNLLVYSSAFVACLGALSGCGPESAFDGPQTDDSSWEEQASALSTSAASSCDPTVAAGDGWINRAVPSESRRFSVSWRSSVSSGVSENRPIDTVTGFSRGAAGAFRDLGPSVRFNPNGNIDARNGSSYAGGFPYTFGEGPYELLLSVDIPAHSYSVWVRHLDSPFKPFEVLAQDFAFRTEQASVTQLDDVATIVDSATGSIQTCGYTREPASGCVQSGPAAWASRPFSTLGSSVVALDFYAWVAAPRMDAVVGAALGAPTRFNDLAASVRFRPDGRFDARNGDVYAADVNLSYSAGARYHFTLTLDLSRSTYSVAITAPGQQSGTVLARDYAFRTQQSGVPSVDHLGQVVDGASGTVNTCALVAH